MTPERTDPPHWAEAGPSAGRLMPRGFLSLPEAVRKAAEGLAPPRQEVIDTPTGRIGLPDAAELHLREPDAGAWATQPPTHAEIVARQRDLHLARAALRAERAISAARTALRRAFADEALTAFWFLPTGEAVPVPPAAWRGTVLLGVWEGEPLAWQPMDRSVPKFWGEVMVREADLARWLRERVAVAGAGTPPASGAHRRKVSPVVATKPRRGGSAPSAAVQKVKVELGAKLAAEGLPEPGDGGQAILERWFADHLDKAGSSLSESRIRKHVRDTITAHRTAVSGESG